MPERRTIRLAGGPRGDEYREAVVDPLADTVMFPVLGERGLEFEVYRRTGDCDFEFVRSEA